MVLNLWVRFKTSVCLYLFWLFSTVIFALRRCGIYCKREVGQFVVSSPMHPDEKQSYS